MATSLPHLAIFNDHVGLWLAWDGSLVRIVDLQTRALILK
jgi:hypothetical protein